MMSWRQNIFLSRYFSMFRVSLGSLPSLTRNHIISVYTVYNIAIYIIYIYIYRYTLFFRTSMYLLNQISVLGSTCKTTSTQLGDFVRIGTWDIRAIAAWPLGTLRYSARP